MVLSADGDTEVTDQTTRTDAGGEGQDMLNEQIAAINTGNASSKRNKNKRADAAAANAAPDLTTAYPAATAQKPSTPEVAAVKADPAADATAEVSAEPAPAEREGVSEVTAPAAASTVVTEPAPAPGVATTREPREPAATKSEQLEEVPVPHPSALGKKTPQEIGGGSPVQAASQATRMLALESASQLQRTGSGRYIDPITGKEAVAKSYLADSAKAWGAATSPPPDAVAVVVPHGQTFFSYEELKQMRPESGIDMTGKEHYLNDEDFAKVFGKDRAAFFAQPAWRRQIQKKEAGLW